MARALAKIPGMNRFVLLVFLGTTFALQAQQVTVVQKLDANLDWRQFRLGSFGFGDLVFQVPDNLSYYQTTLDLKQLLGFNVDANFSDALDGLILVDLTRTGRTLLERYLGKREAATFLDFQKGTYGTHKGVGLDELGAANRRGGHSPANAVL